MTTTAPPAPPKTRRQYSIQPFGILVLGCFVIPVLISILTNSYDAPDAEVYVRMAFGAVAGQTVAIIAALAVVVIPLVRRAPVGVVMTNAVVALVLIVHAVNSMGSTITQLLTNLGVAG